MLLEVIGKSISDVSLLEKSKADRVEYCSRLLEGGLTPSFKEIKKVTKKYDIKINVMIRSSSANFHFNKKEFLKMKKDAKRFCEMDINGIVIGIINKSDNTINYEWTKQLVDIAKRKGKEVTFHRAIDLVPDYKSALDTLNKLGVDRILTTGGKDPITNNLNELDILKKMNKVKILAGSGINENNVNEIKLHADEIHIGTAARHGSWSNDIDINEINKIKDMIS